GHSAASIAWLGYDAPSGWGRWRVAGHHSAREGARSSTATSGPSTRPATPGPETAAISPTITSTPTATVRPR
ncbi:hypothetical protein H7H51_12630, partial [Mycolicibacterium farcinogenes]|nr:hypothetical protein [Mycolicibacterium farcinogenes]